MPLVSVIILSWNRKDELRHTLVKVYEQDYQNIEVIVVDNASSDGSPYMVAEEFPEVILIRLERNIGIAGWNEGFKIASGEYILVLDDDAYPAKNAISLSVDEFGKDDSAACITFNLINISSGDFYQSTWLPQNKKVKTYWPVFVGCAFIVKRNRLPDTFVFPEDYFLYQHELPMSAEIYIYDKKIAFIPQIIGFHNFKIPAEYKIYNDIMNFKNTLKFIVTYSPIILLPFYYLQCVLFFFSRSLVRKWFLKYVSIVLKTYGVSSNHRLPFKNFLFLRSIKVFNYSVIGKFIKK